MRCPRVSLWGVLWLWLPVAGGRPLRPDKVQADTRNLTRTLSTRIRHLQASPGGHGGDTLRGHPRKGHPIG